MNPLLSGRAIVKNNILNGISADIAPGEFVSVMGPSGSGKSTLLYALSGMDAIDGGEVTFEGRRFSDLTDDGLSDLRRNRMGFVFQQPTLLKNLNLLDNIILPQMRDHRRDGKQLTQKARKLMEQIGIDELEQREITKVSGGQLQRAGICRALMGDPSILFCDEPTGALNSKAAREVMDLFSQINAGGTAILLVTHDAYVAARASRVLFLCDGRIVGETNLGIFSHEAVDQRKNTLLQEMRKLGI